MLLSKLLKSLNIEFKAEDAYIEYITDNSKSCVPGSIFVCHRGAEEYINEAKENGAVYVLTEKEVSDTRKALSFLCAEYHGRAYEKLKLIGVTGTNGKTTVASMIYHILRSNGLRCGLLSTTGYLSCENSKKPNLTTPEPFLMHKLMKEMVSCGSEYCIVECSSQGLFQMRLYPMTFEIGIFTNLTDEHLDYHGTKENYRKAKEILMENSMLSIINADDESADDFIRVAKGKTITYSVKNDSADFTARDIKSTVGNEDYIVVSEDLIHRIHINLPGIYNVSNSLSALIASYSLGLPLAKIAFSLKSFYGVKGRFEIVETNKDFTVIIDYAHTPDSLKQVLLTLGSIKEGRILTLFGCGGNRDKSKRSLMGEIASFYSDAVILTNDNPRKENPSDIIKDILSGTENSINPVYIIENRKEAIAYALKWARKNDIILLAGKGHETYQIIGEETLPFDEREIVLSLLK